MGGAAGVRADEGTNGLVGEVAHQDANGGGNGLPDPITNELAALGNTLEDIDRAHRSSAVRAAHCTRNGQLASAKVASEVADGLKAMKAKVGRQLKTRLQAHVLWPWLSDKPGLSGPTVARLIAVIRDPRRFPGQICALGHYHPTVFAEGSRCSYQDAGGNTCGAPIAAPRPGTGVRSLWHYLGLHVVDGRSPRLTKGRQGDWNTRGRTLVLGPDGIADQIVKQRTEPYRSVYDQTKARLATERGVLVIDGADVLPAPATDDRGGAEVVGASGQTDGSVPGSVDALRATTAVAPGREGSPDTSSAVDSTFGGALRTFQIHAIAKKIAAKHFVADLLTTWKGLV